MQTATSYPCSKIDTKILKCSKAIVLGQNGFTMLRGMLLGWF
ncbi:hypothetical protein AN402_311 [Bacillus wiedmannii]|nr:hypothetical protein [Bacillus wiedmannii]KPU51184.1 hypothetical protein AN402_311 [Bacillus wiedmannii]